MPTVAEIERKAMSLLRKAGITAPPTDVVKVAGILKAEIRYEPTDADVSGALLPKGKTALVAVNSLHAENRQRFTIAHELGHLALHVQDIKQELLHVDRDANFSASDQPQLQVAKHFRRDNVSASATDGKEIEANQFAAALLMPAKFIVEIANGLKIPLDGPEIEDLARRFRVSTQAMNYRLVNLGIPVRL